MREKENDAESKDKLVSGAQTEKKRLEAELAELRDHMDIKERKINVLQRKVFFFTLVEISTEICVRICSMHFKGLVLDASFK